MQPVRVERLAVHNLLNLSPAEFDLADRLTIVHGDNAQGKTNFIEAIHLALRLAPFRRKRNPDLVRAGAQSATVSAGVHLPSGRRQVTVTVTGERRIARIDGKTPSRVPGFRAEALAVVFVPDDLFIVKGAPALRRGFLDNAIANLYPRYRTLLSEYKKVVLQKNRLLAAGGAVQEEIRAWNARQVELGAKIVAARARFIRRFNPGFRRIFSRISGSDGLVDIDYVPKLDHVETLEGKPLRAGFHDALEENMLSELRAGRTLFGPHLDTVAFRLDGRPAAAQASQGQQRMLVLALKFLELDLILEERGIIPVVLLDDVASELDATRNRLLMQKVVDVGCQVFVTATGPRQVIVPAGAEVRYLEVTDGRVISRD